MTDPALIEGAIAAVEAFARRAGPDGQPPIALAVGDGNHSLATAKAWWEEVKKGLSPAETAAHPARYCLVEIENIHDPAIRFEPIHRAVFGANADALPEEMTRFFAAQGAALRTGPQAADAGAAAQRFTLLAGGRRLDCALTGSPAPLCVGSIEAFLATGCPPIPVRGWTISTGRIPSPHWPPRARWACCCPRSKRRISSAGSISAGCFPKRPSA